MSGLDASILGALYAMRDPALVQFFVFITHFGSTVIIGSGALGLGVYFLFKKKLALFAGLCTSIMGTVLFVFAAKDIVARARPDTLYQAYLETGFSFPSGHASFSMALYGFFAFFLWEKFPELRMYILSGFGLLVALIGFSRLYLGLHYLSDVVAGYFVGSFFLTLGILLAKRLRRGSISS